MHDTTLVGACLATAAFAAFCPAQRQFFLDPRKAPMPLQMAATRAMYAGDLNGDGRPDLLIANASEPTPDPARASWVLHNRGHGRLENTTAPGSTANVVWYGVGDLDGDGDLDALFQRAFLSDAFGIAVNDGTGAFTYRDGLLPPRFPMTFAIADLDGDTDLDLYSGGDLYLNQGSLVFTDASATLPIRSFQTINGAGDFDGDGDLDLASADANGLVHQLVNDGTAHFTDATATRMPAAIGAARALVVGDVDGDGDPDIVVGNHDLRLIVYRNDGSGTFAFDPQLGSRTWKVVSIGAGDVDGDGDLDLALGLDQGGSLLLNQGGSFVEAPAGRWSAGAQRTTAAVLVDLDQDGDRDLAIGCDGPPDALPTPGLESRVFFNDGLGAFLGTGDGALPTSFDDGFGALADLDGDGDLDVLDTQGTGRLWRNDTFGAFVPIGLFLPVSGRPITGDLDGDGDLDAVLVESAGGFHVLFNAGSGWLWPAWSFWLPPLPIDGCVGTAALGDLDGDGDLDLFLGTYCTLFGACAPDALWHNDGTGFFHDASHLLPGGPTNASGAALGDVDNDADLDIVTSGGFVYVNGPSGFAAQPLVIARNRGECHLALADLDGDGWLDLVAGTSCLDRNCLTPGSRDVVHWNDGAGGFDAGNDLELALTWATGVVVGDVDDDGDLDFVIGHRGQVNPSPRVSPENLLYVNEGQRVLRRAGGNGTSLEFPLDFDETRGVALGDVDADGDPDLVVLNRAVDAGRTPRAKLHAGLARHLAAPDLARPGHPYALHAHGADGGAFLFTSLAPANVPLPPYGVLGVDPGALLWLVYLGAPAAGRVATITLDVPADPGLAGIALWSQAAVLGATATRFTNRVADTISAH